MLDLKLCFHHRQAALVKRARHFELFGREQFGSGVLKRTHRNDRQPRINLHTRNRITRRGTEECFLEIEVCDTFGCTGKTCTELHAGRPHLQIGRNRLAPSDSARDEHRHLLCNLG